MFYLLSVVIPTKNRYEYLKGCISSLIELDYSKVEIVIQDNTLDNKEILTYLSQYNKGNIKYYHTTESISQTENSELAVGNASGKYVCYIGDDDSVSDKILEVTEYLDNHQIESCITSMARFNWPDLVFSYHKMPSLIFSDATGKVSKYDPNSELNKVIKSGAKSLFRMPRTYHGIVKREVLEKAKDLTGSYFPGPSPDIANAVALCHVVKNHVYIDIPVILDGFSYKSAGGQGTRKQHVGKIRDISMLPKNTEDAWEDTIPKIWTGETIYAESVIKALKSTGNETLIKKFNFPYHYANFIAHHPSNLKFVEPHMKGRRFKVFLYSSLIIMKRAKNYISNKATYKFKLSHKNMYENIDQIEEALRKVNLYNQKITIKK